MRHLCQCLYFLWIIGVSSSYLVVLYKNKIWVNPRTGFALFYYLWFKELLQPLLIPRSCVQWGNTGTKGLLSPTVALSFFHKYYLQFATGRAHLIRTHSWAGISFKISGNSNYSLLCNLNLANKFILEITLV